MSVITLDLTYNVSVYIRCDQAVYTITIEIPNDLDTAYTLSIGGVNYSVGSGISLQTNPNDAIIITLDCSDLNPGSYKGVLRSASQVAGTFLKIPFEVLVL